MVGSSSPATRSLPANCECCSLTVSPFGKEIAMTGLGFLPTPSASALCGGSRFRQSSPPRLSPGTRIA